MKIQKTSTNVSPFAGISFANAIFNNCGLSQLIDKELGIRATTVGYTYSDIIRNFANIIFCGGNCAEDSQAHLGKYLRAIPGNRVPSADTMLRGIKQLTTENQIFSSKQDNQYTFNINTKLNRLNIKSLLLTNQLQPDNEYDFDYDNQVIATCKYDAKNTYKKNRGYLPGVASIDDKIVYIENRDGNANVKFEQAATLTRAYSLLQENGIHINRSRMDAGSYSKEIIKVVTQNSKLFYIRANKCADLFEQILQIETWQTVEINYKIYQVASLKFTQFFADENFRLVVMREKSDDSQLDLFTRDNFIYRTILTNDWESDEKQVIEYYNQRGKSEKLFDVMNNDFCWKHLPCSFINENASFLIITALIKNFYNYLVAKISKVFGEIKPTTRLKRFIFRFISVSGKWIYSARQWVLKLYSDSPYERLQV
ncbi:MAG: IS1380 family transposase [Bacteroidetes bacterium]|nr:IS1380 family transposase [Bacteroidota bacterium]MBU1717967.1 IS1380 family transposase [Bacteroidota bacterium]